MKNFVRINESRSTRPLWLSTSAVAMAAVAAGVAGIAAGPGSAAPVRHAAKASQAHKADRFKHPKLRHGVLTIEGTEAGDRIALRLQAGDPGVLQVDVGDDGSADFSFERARVTSIAVDAAAGDDSVRIDESNGSFTDSIPTTIDGGPGNDTIAGGKGVETLRGGDGNDTIDGNGGNDLAFLGAGDDTFVWDPGDGSDTVEGQDGSDTLVFNGANVAEHVDLSANGNRLRFFRDVGNITMDTGGVETVDFNALGGADLVTLNYLTGCDVGRLNLDLGAGDGQTDRVAVIGTSGNDDTFVWDPGDGSDTVEGQDGADTMRFNGANVSEHVDLSANGGRLRFFRDVANITMDTAGVERVDFNALGGADSVTVNDLTGTDV